MSGIPKIILATPPETAAAVTHSGIAAHMSYRIGHGFRLYRSQRASDIRGGFMVLDTSGFTGGGPMASLIADIIGECGKRAFTGIVINAGSYPGSPSQISLSMALAKEALTHSLEYFVPEDLAETGDHTIVRISAAISGGTLTRRLVDAIKKYGTNRLAVEIERVMMDFSLPALSGTGRELSNNEFRALIDRHNPKSFFSPELMVNYFTYHDNHSTHFVLHDNAETLQRKLKSVSDMGSTYAFLFYPRIADIFGEIFTDSNP
ncbi:MAG: hypothetical protein FWC90_05340 [Oscillospiraceae bacterium]|nr:hypothetical protein [Oscillospiraceae bacterium]